MRIDNEFGMKRVVKEESLFSLNVFNLYSETILRQLEDQSVFIIGKYNLKKRCHVRSV